MKEQFASENIFGKFSNFLKANAAKFILTTLCQQLKLRGKIVRSMCIIQMSNGPELTGYGDLNLVH